MSDPTSSMRNGPTEEVTQNQIDEENWKYRSAVREGSLQASEEKLDEQGVENFSPSDEDDEQDDDYYEIRNHRSYEQVMLDVDRCSGRLRHIRQSYLHRTDDDESLEDLTRETERERLASDTNNLDYCRLYSSENNGQTDRNPEIPQGSTKYLQYQQRLKKKLAKLIVRLLIRKPNLHYYQGFHDVCLTYMSIYGDVLALEKLDSLIDSHFAIFMQPTMDETQEFLHLIPMIIGLQDEKLLDYLEKAELGTIFALSWVITWFSHVIPNECDVKRIFAHLQATDDPHLVLYLCAEIVLSKKEKLLQMQPEMSTVHHFLCQVPRKEKLPIEELLAKAIDTFNKWPPEIVKEKLSYHRRRLHMQKYNLIRSFAEQIYPTVTSLVSSPASRRAVIVFIVASALALQFDRWIR